MKDNEKPNRSETPDTVIPEKSGPDKAKPEKVKREKPEESAVSRFANKYPVVYMTLTLLLLTAVVAFALGFVHEQTDPVIKERQKQELVASVSTVVPDSTDSAPLEGYAFASEVSSARVAYGDAQKTLGYAIEVTPNGFGGAIRMLVGVSPEGVVTGVVVLDMKETPNLGTKTREKSFLDQFIGKEHDFKMGPGQDVQAITGATVSSKAVSAGVSAAIAAVLLITQGGGA